MILYRARSAAVAASLLQGRGRVRIKSRDQHSRDLATLGPEVPLGHPPLCENLSGFCCEGSSTRCKAESQVNRPQIQLLQDAGGDISPVSPSPFVHPFWGLSQTRLYIHLVANCVCLVYMVFKCHVLARIVYIAQYET